MSNIVKVVDGWQVEDRDGQATVLDVGLAEHAQMGQPRDIRKVIARAIDDGALNIACAERDADSPTFWRETIIVSLGNGATTTTEGYRLNRAAALFIVTRLRTPKAVELTLAIVKVFDQVTSGRALAPAIDTRLDAVLATLASVAASLASLASGHKALAQSVEQLTSGAPDVSAGRAFATTIKVKMRRYAQAQCNGTKADLRSWVSKGHSVLRTAVNYTQGTGRGWASLAVSRRQEVETVLNEMIATAEKAACGRAQLTLVPQPPPDPKTGPTGTGTGGE